MKANPQISIVLPCFNGEAFLKESIESCRSQTFTNWELIIVDDHSNDGTAQIIEAYGKLDWRIRSIRNEKNLKLPATLNRGLKLARATYVTWTSDDNRYRPQAFERMFREIERDSSVDIVYADAQLIDKENGNQGIAPSSPRHLLWLFNGIGACFLFKRSLLEERGYYDEQMFLVEDYEFWLRNSNSKYLHLPELLYDYRLHSQSLTNQRRQDVLQKTIELLLGKMEKMPLSNSDRTFALIQVSYLSVLRRQLGLAFAFACRAIRQDFLLSIRFLPKQIFLALRRTFAVKV